MNLRNTLIIGLVLIAWTAVAQEKREPPILLELILGNNRYGMQTIINRSLPKSEKLSFFSVTALDTNYENDVGAIDIINTSQVAYELYKGIGITGGLNANKVTGLSPTLGIRYVYASPKLVMVFTPDYIFTSDRNIAVFSLIEYHPELKEDLRLYSRVQGLYNHNLNSDAHQRSYLQLRLGIGIKDYNFGFATNLDYFGPEKIFAENFGIFIRTSL
ncbi:MAG: hypothetical protein R8G66_21940 [Cytophagales bacterium]|nr:hypothetical protein [Cytophagales bacterium]